MDGEIRVYRVRIGVKYRDYKAANMIGTVIINEALTPAKLRKRILERFAKMYEQYSNVTIDIKKVEKIKSEFLLAV